MEGGEGGEIAGGPLESDGAGEHGPESQEKNGGKYPELVSGFAEYASIAF